MLDSAYLDANLLHLEFFWTADTPEGTKPDQAELQETQAIQTKAAVGRGAL